MVKRNANGQFQKGTAAGPGRPLDPIRKNLKSLYSVCKKSDWQKIVAKAVEQAIGGDAKAREWLSKYMVANPMQLHFSDELEEQPVEFVVNITPPDNHNL